MQHLLYPYTRRTPKIIRDNEYDLVKKFCYLEDMIISMTGKNSVRAGKFKGKIKSLVEEVLLHMVLRSFRVEYINRLDKADRMMIRPM